MTTTTQQIDNFISLVQKGIDAWIDAGKLLVELKRIDASILTRITSQAPWIEPAALAMFIKVGEGTIHPKVLLLPPMVAEKVARMPMPTQQRLVEKPVAIIRREVKEMTRNEPPAKRGTNATGLADKMPTVGFWKITVMNGKAFMTRTEADTRAIPMVLDETSSCYIQVLSPTAKFAEKKPDPAPPDQSLTPIEREYRKFRETA